MAASKTRTFGTFAAHHLAQKAINEEADAQWLDSAQRHLEVARDYFGEDTDLARIQVADVTKYVGYLRKRSNGRSGTMASGTTVHYLNSVSNMFDRAISEGIVQLGANPVSAMVSKPKITRKKTLWLEVHEMAAILKFAKEYVPARGDLAIPYFFEILAGYALTGMRESELLGLQVSDVDLERLARYKGANNAGGCLWTRRTMPSKKWVRQAPWTDHGIPIARSPQRRLAPPASHDRPAVHARALFGRRARIARPAQSHPRGRNIRKN